MYSFDYPKGKVFQKDEEIPEGFVDTPTKLGINRLDTDIEVAEKCKIGKSKGVQIDIEEQIDIEMLKAQYEDKFGKKPHHLMKIETIVKAIEED